MSSDDVAIAVRGLSKSYTIAHDDDRPTTLAETLLRRARNPFERPKKETFWALRDLSFDIMRGEVVGIIGRNGAGKSTLLKILSRITEPTSGEVDLFGRVGSLLEVGTGFHPELTGRENVFLNGAILGMTKAEIRAQFDGIVDFSGVGKFLDTPVKRYSSGMYVRLAFAVAAHLSPEILIVDEVLAVGDAEFQKKCLGKMKDVSTQGRTVLFVSHNMTAVRNLCSRVVHLAGGRVESISEASAGVAAYLKEAKILQKDVYNGVEGLTLANPRFTRPDGEPTGPRLEFGQSYQLRMAVSSPKPFKSALVVAVYDEDGTRVSSINSLEEGCQFWDLGQVREIVCEVPNLALIPGNYHVTIDLCSWYDLFLRAESAVSFTVDARAVRGAECAYNKSHGVCRIGDGVYAR